MYPTVKLAVNRSQIPTNGIPRPKCWFYFISLALCCTLAQAPVSIAQENRAEETSKVVLTESEALWLKTNPKVTFTGDPNWLPYEAFNKKGEYIGIVSQHLKLISQTTGIDFEMSQSSTWTESIIKAKKGEVQVLSETDDSDLKSHLTFTEPYLSNPIVIAMRIEEHYVENIHKIENRRIALIKDYGYASKIRRQYPNIEFITVADIQDGLVSVSTGKVDALLCTLALCSYTIHELGINDVKITGKTEFDTKLALGVQKNLPELLSILNKGIAKITQGQQQSVIENWIKHDYIEKVDHTISYLVALISLSIISFVVYVNRRLTREVELRKEAEKQLQKSSDNNELYRTLFDGSAIGHAVNNLASGDFLSVNQCFADITGYDLDELNTLSYWDLTPQRYEQEEEQQLADLNTKGSYGPYEKHYIHKDGHEVAVRLNGSRVVDSSGEQLIVSAVEDISAFEEVKSKLRMSSLILENSSEAMVITDENNRIITANPAFTQISGYELDDVLGKDPGFFKSGRHKKEFYQKMWESLNERDHWQGEIWDKHKNGDNYAKWLTINAIRDEDNAVSRYVAVFSDITQRKIAEETIWRQANFDGLTELPNRNMFHHTLQEKITSASRSNTGLALLLIDLDQFKQVNDTLGHDMGDQLLQLASKRIVSSVRKSDFVSRLGGDEFTIILNDYQSTSNVEIITQKIISRLSEPYELEDEVVHGSASIGITYYPQHAETMKALIKNADQAMYAAKNEGRNCYACFKQELQDHAQKHLRLSQDLRAALTKDQFQVYFQPAMDLRTNQISKAEALIRWHHPENGLVPPLEFIPIAEAIGVINEVGNWVYHESFEWKQRWNEMFDIDLQISVNMSPAQFKVSNDEFAKEWLALANTGNLKKQNIIIEITEGLLLNSDPEVLNKFLRLHDAGLEVAIDDFGTGYSSLSYLKKFDIDYLKIDQSFVRNLENDDNDLALSEAIIVMAHKLGIKVIAEGVETKAQEALLTEAGCDFAQGYLYSKPVPADQFESFLRNHLADQRQA